MVLIHFPASSSNGRCNKGSENYSSLIQATNHSVWKYIKKSHFASFEVTWGHGCHLRLLSQFEVIWGHLRLLMIRSLRLLRLLRPLRSFEAWGQWGHWCHWGQLRPLRSVETFEVIEIFEIIEAFEVIEVIEVTFLKVEIFLGTFQTLWFSPKKSDLFFADNYKMSLTRRNFPLDCKFVIWDGWW